MEYAQSSHTTIIDLINCINIGCPERQIKIQYDLLVPGQAAIIPSKKKEAKDNKKNYI